MMLKRTRALSCALASAVAAALATPAMAAEDGSPSLPASRQLVCIPGDTTAGASLDFIAAHGDADAPKAVGLVSATGNPVTVNISSKAPSTTIGAGLVGTHVVRIEGKSYNITAVGGASPNWTFTIGTNSAAVGDYAEIVPRPTLNTVFGANNKYGLEPDDPFAADGFDTVFAVRNGALEEYKYVSTFNQWQTLGGTIVGDLPLDADGGFAVRTQAGSSAGLIPMSALAHKDNHVLTIGPGTRLYSWPFGGTTLDGSGLSTVLDKDDPFATDTFDVILIETGGAVAEYKYVDTFNQWQTLGGAVIPGTTPIVAGTAFAIRRTAAITSDLSINLPIAD